MFVQDAKSSRLLQHEHLRRAALLDVLVGRRSQCARNTARVEVEVVAGDGCLVADGLHLDRSELHADLARRLVVLALSPRRRLSSRFRAVRDGTEDRRFGQVEALHDVARLGRECGPETRDFGSNLFGGDFHARNVQRLFPPEQCFPRLEALNFLRQATEVVPSCSKLI